VLVLSAYPISPREDSYNSERVRLVGDSVGRMFECNLRGDIENKLKAIKAAAKKKKVVFRGNVEKGSFHKDVIMPVLGKMRVLGGNYRIQGGIITVTITVKPPTYNWDKKETEVRDFIESD